MGLVPGRLPIWAYAAALGGGLAAARFAGGGSGPAMPADASAPPAAGDTPAAAGASDLWGSFGGSAGFFAPSQGIGLLNGVSVQAPGQGDQLAGGGLGGSIGSSGSGSSSLPPPPPVYIPPVIKPPVVIKPPSPTPTPAPTTSIASPTYKATVIRATHLWNDQTKRWVYTLAVGTVLSVRGAYYLKGGVGCHPVNGPAPYSGGVYYVPVANVRLG